MCACGRNERMLGGRRTITRACSWLHTTGRLSVYAACALTVLICESSLAIYTLYTFEE
jgi:hypothetical protein